MNARDFATLAGSAGATLLLPILAAQGARLRRRTPIIGEASGPDHGRVEAMGSPLRVTLLGESTVAGVGAPDHSRALAGQVGEALSAGTGRAVSWRAVGKSGLTARQGLLELVPRLSPEPLDVLLIVFGVNDVLEFRSPARWSKDLAEVTEAARRRAAARVVAWSAVPPLGSFPAFPQPLRAALGLRSAALDLAARRTAADLGVSYCPARLEGSAAPLFCSDRFHPSPLGYTEWARQLARTLVPLVL